MVHRNTASSDWTTRCVSCLISRGLKLPLRGRFFPFIPHFSGRYEMDSSERRTPPWLESLRI